MVRGWADATTAHHVASAPITKSSSVAIQNTPCGRKLLADTTAADRTLAHLIRKDRTLAQRES